MKKLFLSAIALMSFSGCTSMGVASDGYRFQNRQWTNHEFRVIVKEYDSQKELTAAALKVDVAWRTHITRAFASVDRANNTCTIHLLKPEFKWLPQWPGHEIGHCIWGNFHPSRR